MIINYFPKRYPQGGDEYADKTASDIVIEIVEIPHERFRR